MSTRLTDAQITDLDALIARSMTGEDEPRASAADRCITYRDVMQRLLVFRDRITLLVDAMADPYADGAADVLHSAIGMDWDLDDLHQLDQDLWEIAHAVEYQRPVDEERAARCQQGEL